MGEFANDDGVLNDSCIEYTSQRKCGPVQARLAITATQRWAITNR